MDAIAREEGLVDDRSDIQMDRTYSSCSLHDTIEIDGDSSKDQEYAPDLASNGNDTTIDPSQKRKNSYQAFSSFSYTNYWQLGELGSKNNAPK